MIQCDPNSPEGKAKLQALEQLIEVIKGMMKDRGAALHAKRNAPEEAAAAGEGDVLAEAVEQIEGGEAAPGEEEGASEPMAAAGEEEDPETYMSIDMSGERPTSSRMPVKKKKRA